MSALHVSQLAHVVVLRRRAVRSDRGRPAEEGITGGLHQPLSRDDALTLVLVDARASVRRQDRLLRLLDLEEQWRSSRIAHQEQHERLGAHRAHTDDLACEIGEPVAVDHLAQLDRERVLDSERSPHAAPPASRGAPRPGHERSAVARTGSGTRRRPGGRASRARSRSSSSSPSRSSGGAGALRIRTRRRPIVRTSPSTSIREYQTSRKVMPAKRSI